MHSIDVAWLAGILEGEACFDWNNTSKGKLYPRIRIEMKDRDVIYRIQSLAGGNIHLPAPFKSHHSKTWMLQICKRTEVLPILKSILPHMGRRRSKIIKEQIHALEA